MTTIDSTIIDSPTIGSSVGADTCVVTDRSCGASSFDELTWQSSLFAAPRRQSAIATEAPSYDGIDAQLADARSRLRRISARAAYQEVLWGRSVLVDIRPAGQRAAEGEVSASLTPLVVERNVLEWRFDPRQTASLPIAGFDLRIVVLCQEGYTSSLAADALQRLGMHHATDVVGGFAAWRDAGLPLAG